MILSGTDSGLASPERAEAVECGGAARGGVCGESWTWSMLERRA